MNAPSLPDYPTRPLPIFTCCEPVLSPGPAFQMLLRDLLEETVGSFARPGGAEEFLPAPPSPPLSICGAPPVPPLVSPLLAVLLGSGIGLAGGLAGLDPKRNVTPKRGRKTTGPMVTILHADRERI